MFGVPKYWERIQLNNYLNRMKYMVNDKVLNKFKEIAHGN